MRVILKRGNDQDVTLVGLRTTAQPPIYLNTAVTKATLLDNKGAVVSPFDNVVMPYVEGSQGDYVWHVEGPTTLNLPKNVEYSLVFMAVQDGLDYRAVHPVSVVDGD